MKIFVYDMIPQIALAEATVIWDNSFCQNGEKPIEEVTWAQLGKVLSSWFKMQTGRGLSDNNVRCLGRKLLRSDHVSDKVMFLVCLLDEIVSKHE